MKKKINMVKAFDTEPFEFAMVDPEWRMDDLHIHMLHRLAMLPEVKVAVEVGSYKGASTSALVAAVNNGALDHLHIVEINPRPSLRKVIELCKFREKITVHTRPYWELSVSADLVFIDGDHGWPAVADVLHAVSYSTHVIAMHDSTAWPKIKGCWGANMAASNLRRIAGRSSFEDRETRPGMATDRGFLVSVAAGFTNMESLASSLNSCIAP